LSRPSKSPARRAPGAFIGSVGPSVRSDHNRSPVATPSGHPPNRGNFVADT
jgi:hypothetical protein